MKTNIALSVICLAAASAFGGIKDAYTGRFRIGAALGKWVYEQTPNAESDVVAANFSSITAENEMKPERVQPREGRDEKLRFFLRQGDGEWRQIGGEEKADVLTTGTAGGFIGATIGMYATGGCAK